MKTATLLLSTAAMALYAAPAYAQAAAPADDASAAEPAPAQDATADEAFGEILVTAQRRSESVQDVPIAI